MKEYSFEEVIANIKVGESYECTDTIYYIKKITRNEIGILYNDGEPIERCGTNDLQRLIKIKKPVSFMDVVRSDSKCCVEYRDCKPTHYKYLRDIILILIEGYGEVGLKKAINEGLWYLEY